MAARRAAAYAARNSKKHLSTNFGDEGYWNERYGSSAGDSYEWYLDIDVATAILTPYLETEGDKSSRILVLGCGNSAFSAELFGLGYRNIVNIDFSSIVINEMQERYRHCQGMQFLTMNVLNLGHFADSSIDFIFDKGCLDAVFCRTDGVDCVHNVCEQLSRVLVDKGTFISVSYAQAAMRIPHYRKPVHFLWSCEPTNVLNKEKDCSYTCFICKKDVEKWSPAADDAAEQGSSSSEEEEQRGDADGEIEEEDDGEGEEGKV